MPFTASHPALVLPLTYLPSKYYSLTGLIVGSLVPDFEYFFRLQVKSIYSHTLLGILWFDLPVALLLCFVFHQLVRDSLIRNAPNFIKSRVSKAIDFNWVQSFKKRYLIVIFSILAGAFSHLLWDSFTHESGLFIETIPILKSSLDVNGHNIPVFKILQHGSTLVGAIVLILVFFKLPQLENTGRFNLRYWILIIAATFLILALFVFFKIDRFEGSAGSGFSVGGSVGELVVSGISASILAMILISASYRLKSYSNR